MNNGREGMNDNLLPLTVAVATIVGTVIYLLEGGYL